MSTAGRAATPDGPEVGFIDVPLSKTKERMVSKHFDFISIGAGSGGLAAIQRAAKHGAKCAVIEANDLGGTCVNLGCVPKKVMWNAGMMADMLSLSNHYGFEIESQQFSFENLVTKRQLYIERLRKNYAKRLQDNQITLIRGYAEFKNENTLVVEDNEYTADKILIATGSQAMRPEISGADFGMTSDGFFDLKALPHRAAIIGAGYIAVELAGILHHLGCETHLAYRYDQLLRRYDPILGETLGEIMAQQGIQTHANANAKSVQRNANGSYQINFQEGLTLEGFDCVIWAIGRRANIANLQLANAGIEIDNHENIIVDEWQQTTINHIYAIGDVTGQAPLTPVAIAAGRRLADRLFAERETKLDYQNIPTVIFSYPPIASVGLSEPDARKKHGEIKVFQSRFNAMLYALSDKPIPTLIKVITDQNEKVLGVHLIGDHADEILQGFAVALKMGATLQDFRDTVAIHPTSAEEIVTIDP